MPQHSSDKCKRRVPSFSPCTLRHIHYTSILCLFLLLFIIAITTTTNYHNNRNFLFVDARLSLQSTVPYPSKAVSTSMIQDPFHALGSFIAIESTPYSCIVRSHSRTPPVHKNLGMVDYIFLSDGESDVGQLMWLDSMHLSEGEQRNLTTRHLVAPVYNYLKHRLILVHFEVSSSSFRRLSDIVLDDDAYGGPVRTVYMTLRWSMYQSTPDALYIVHVNGAALRVLSEIEFGSDELKKTSGGATAASATDDVDGDGDVNSSDMRPGIELKRQVVLPRVIPLSTEVDEGCYFFVVERFLYFFEKRYSSSRGIMAKTTLDELSELSTEEFYWSNRLEDPIELVYVNHFSRSESIIVAHFSNETGYFYGSPYTIPSPSKYTRVVEGAYVGNIWFSVDSQSKSLYVLNQPPIDEDFYDVSPANVQRIRYDTRQVEELSGIYEGLLTGQSAYHNNDGSTGGVTYVGYSPNYDDNQVIYQVSVANGSYTSADIASLGGSPICSFYSKYYDQFYIISGELTIKVARYDRRMNRIETKILGEAFYWTILCDVDVSGKYVWILSNFRAGRVMKMELETYSVVASHQLPDPFTYVSYLIPTNEYLLIGEGRGSQVMRVSVDDLSDVSTVQFDGSHGLIQDRNVFTSHDGRYLFTPIRHLERGISIYPLSVREMKILGTTGTIVDASSRISCVVTDGDDRFFFGINKDAPNGLCSIVGASLTDKEPSFLKNLAEYHVDLKSGGNCQIETCFESLHERFGYFVSSQKLLFSVDFTRTTRDKMDIVERIPATMKFKLVDVSRDSAFVIGDDLLYRFDIDGPKSPAKYSSNFLYLIIGCSVGGAIIALSILTVLAIVLVRYCCSVRGGRSTTKPYQGLIDNNDIQMNAFLGE